MKKNVVIILSVVLLLIVGSAVAFAEGVLTDDQQNFLNERTETIQQLVDEGRITQEQADEYLENIEEHLLDGTCQGDGVGCIDGGECVFGLNEDGECLGGLGIGYNSEFCGLNYEGYSERGFGCGGFFTGRGCGR